MEPELFNNDDILHRIMLLLGPRQVCLGIGATCHRLRDIAKDDMVRGMSNLSMHLSLYTINHTIISVCALIFLMLIFHVLFQNIIKLWKEFSQRRCMIDVPDDSGTNSVAHAASAKIDDFEEEECHEAAKMFKKSYYDMLNVADGTTYSSSNLTIGTSVSHENLYSFYTAYVHAHRLVKTTNLRLDKQNDSRQKFCTQTWPRSLCNRDDINRFNNDYASHTVTCLNPAEVWCDYPSCEEARCGRKGCLRCYRFLPRDYTLSANGMIVGRQSERSYDLVSFVKCSWCSVSFCNKHVVSNFQTFRDSDKEQNWYHCDVCEVSSCPDCVSQVFLRTPDMRGCPTITSGRVCGRKTCKDCVWYVVKSKTAGRGSEVVAKQGGAIGGIEKVDWTSIEECCPTCVARVKKRMEEMQLLQESFMGFMP